MSKGLCSDVRQAELISLPFADDTFDIVVNLFLSFGFYESDADNLRCVKELSRVLKPNGKFLFFTEVNVPLVAKGLYRQPTKRLLEDGSLLTIREQMDWNSKRLTGSWTVQWTDDRYDHKETHDYSMRVYTFEEFREICEEANLSEVRPFGSFDYSSQTYSDTSEEMIVVASKR